VADLSAKARRELPKSDFAIPSTGAYPIEDAAHARDALARVAQNGSATEKAAVRAAVKARWPHMDVAQGPDHPNGNS